MNQQPQKAHFCDETEVQFVVPSLKKNVVNDSLSASRSPVGRKNFPLVSMNDGDSPVKRLRRLLTDKSFSPVAFRGNFGCFPLPISTDDKFPHDNRSAPNSKQKLDLKEVSSKLTYKTDVGDEDTIALCSEDEENLLNVELEEYSIFDTQPKRYLRSNVMKDLRAPLSVHSRNKKDYTMKEVIRGNVSKNPKTPTKSSGCVMEENSFPSKFNSHVQSSLDNPSSHNGGSQIVPSALDDESSFEKESVLVLEYARGETYLNDYLLSDRRRLCGLDDKNVKMCNLSKLEDKANYSKSQKQNLAWSSVSNEKKRCLDADDKKRKVSLSDDANCFVSNIKEQWLAKDSGSCHHIVEVGSPFQRSNDNAIAHSDDADMPFVTKEKYSSPNIQLDSKTGESSNRHVSSKPELEKLSEVRKDIAKYSECSVQKSILKKEPSLNSDNNRKIPLRFGEDYRKPVMEFSDLGFTSAKFLSVLEKWAPAGRCTKTMKIPFFFKTGDSKLKRCFEQPINDSASFEKKIQNCTVALECAGIHSSDDKNYISGTIGVKNLNKDKKLYLKVTIDGWKHHDITKCDFLMKCKTEQDVFKFDYTTDAAVDHVMFCVVCKTMDEKKREIRFIDDNDGKYYAFRKK